MNRFNGVIPKGGCHHKCNNTIGSFICLCNEGFALMDDKKTCKGRKYLFITIFLNSDLKDNLLSNLKQSQGDIYVSVK